jgi:hypothetical protein
MPPRMGSASQSVMKRMFIYLFVMFERISVSPLMDIR